MSLLPEWAPHIHPLIVHFPIALLFAAVLVDVFSVLIRKADGLQTAAVVLYSLGALGALAAFLTGRNAADTLTIPTFAQPVLTTHAMWAEWTVWSFGIYAVIRIVAAVVDRQRRLAVSIPLLLIGVGGLYLVYETAEHGAQMVFEHGVGVQAMAHTDAAPAPIVVADSLADTPEGGPVVGADGSWLWTPGVASLAVLPEMLNWVEGDPAAVQFSLVGDPERAAPLAVTTEGGVVLFTVGAALASLQADVELNADDFTGRVTMVHHVQDARNYYYLSLEDGMMRQGRMINGTPEVLESTPHEVTGWLTLRVVGDRGHFRGYQDGKLLTHGHAPEFEAGPVGLRLEGTGTLRLARMQAVALR